MEAIDYLGFLAATLTTIAFLPQVIKTYKSKSVDDISLSMYTVFFVGIVLWLIYGLAIHNLPIILANIVTATLALMIIYLKVKYRTNR